MKPTALSDAVGFVCFQSEKYRDLTALNDMISPFLKL